MIYLREKVFFARFLTRVYFAAWNDAVSRKNNRGDGWYEEYTELVKYNKQLEKNCANLQSIRVCKKNRLTQ